jgi:predicted MFS family arabinose efflux permease
LIGAPVDLKTWVDLGRNRTIVLLLLVTTLQVSGQFAVFTFMGPLLTRLTQASPDAVGLVFATFGVFGFLGNVIATRLVDRWGSYRTSLLSVAALLAGSGIWAFGAGNFTIMAAAVAVWGLGFASTNSMQQVRLIGAAPALGTASVSLNTSALYIGQAIGSATGGILFARDLLHAAGYVSVAFIALALVVVTLARPRQAAASST